MDDVVKIIPMKDRRYQEIPTDEIKVINSRDRDKDQFEMNTQSIGNVGLLKPIRVNDKFHERSGMYELICGQGRLQSHQKLGHDSILAEIVTCTRKEAYLQSLIENIARTKPDSMVFARELKRLHDEGWSYAQIGSVACKHETYIRDYIRLVEKGEDRLIRGVEQGVFPIKFAIQVASTDDGEIQHLLMDSFDDGIVTTNNFAQARKIITARSKDHKHRSGKEYSVGQLKQDIADVTKVKTSYVREAKSKENRFMTLLDSINTLFRDREFVKLAKQEQLAERPELAGDFGFETQETK